MRLHDFRIFVTNKTFQKRFRLLLMHGRVILELLELLDTELFLCQSLEKKHSFTTLKLNL